MGKWSRKKIDVDMVAFRRDVELGTTVIVLAEKYGIAKSTVWRLKAEISGKIARRELGEMPEPEDAETGSYELKIEVPAERLNSLLTDISEQEIRSAVQQIPAQDKANILQLVLQARFNESTAPAAVVEMPEQASA